MKLRLIICTILLAITSGATAKPEIIDKEVLVTYKLHGQTRKYQYRFDDTDSGLKLTWGIERNLKWQSGSFLIPTVAMENADKMSFLQPVDGEHVVLDSDMTYLMISDKAFADLKTNGHFIYNGTEFTATGNHKSIDGLEMTEVHDKAEGCTIWILDRKGFHLVWEMHDNPLEINWTASLIHK